MDQLRQYRELLEKHMQQQCCTRGFPLDSWYVFFLLFIHFFDWFSTCFLQNLTINEFRRACLDLAKRHFRRAKRGTLRVRHDRALLLDQLVCFKIRFSI